jgi:hypothetical protein
MTEPIYYFPSGSDVPMLANTVGKRAAARLGQSYCPACDLRAAIAKERERQRLEALEAHGLREVKVIVKSKNSAEKPAQGE